MSPPAPVRRRQVPVRNAVGDPLAGVERVFIDGSNLLFALGRHSRDAGPAPAPAGAVIGRLRAAFPPAIVVDLVFDGRSSGGVTGRLATGLRVTYSGRLSADQVIDEGVAAQLAADGPAGTWGILVVTDDRGLRDAVRTKGARTAGTSWLAARIGRAVEGHPRPAAGPPHGDSGRSPGGRSGRLATTSPAPLPKAGTTIGHRRPPRRPGRAAER